MKQLLTKALGTYLNSLTFLSPSMAGQHGFKIFCYPFRAPLHSFHKQFLNASQKFDFEYKGRRLQGYRWGNGPKKVLFLHGWQSHSFRWKNYIEALPQEEYTIFSLDAPGHGYSRGRFLTVPLYAEVIREFVTSLQGVDAVVSHSVGSFSTLFALYQQPGLPVGKVVAMGCPSDALSFINFYQQMLGLSERTKHLILQHFERVIKKPIAYFHAPRFAASLKVPGLIIHDRGDLEAPYSAGVAIHQAWKNSRLISTEGLGHKLKSPEVVHLVVDYIREQEIPPAHAPKPVARFKEAVGDK